jgi:hypothetical protein
MPGMCGRFSIGEIEGIEDKFGIESYFSKNRLGLLIRNGGGPFFDFLVYNPSHILHIKVTKT